MYQLGNWKAGKTGRSILCTGYALYQLGNWKAGKTVRRNQMELVLLYQLGNWKADEETHALLPLTHIWWPA